MLHRRNPALNCRRAAAAIRPIAAAVFLLALGIELALTLPARGQSPELRPANQLANATAPSLQSPGSTPAATTESPAEEGPRPSLAEALERPGDVTFRNMTIEAALFTIGDTWKVNVVTGKEIQGTVNGVFKQAPLREILDAILLANGYSYRAVGDSLVVQASADVGSAHPLFRSVTIPIQYSNLEEIVVGAELLKSTSGQIKAFPSARSLMVLDYADRVETVSAFVARMEAAAAEAAGAAGGLAPSRLDVAYFHTHFVPAESAKPPLLAVLSPLGRVAVMPAENRLLVVDYAANLDMVRKVLDRIDRPRPQVRITALIYDLSLQDVERLGLNWGSSGKGNTTGAGGLPNQALSFQSTTVAPFATNNVAPFTQAEAGGAFTVRSLTRNFDIVTVLDLLQSADDARLLANPNITVMDNEEAVFKSVTEIPYQQISQSELGGQIGTTAFKEAGITLTVLPTIAGDGTIDMLVSPEFSRLAGFTPQEDQPILDTRKATTRVRVANGQTLVLSGLRQRSDTGEFTGIPFLKDVKYIGPLFRSRDTDVRESELVVFIMPQITCYDEPASGREFQAMETVGCRLEAIPYAEGCPATGADGCAGELVPLPPLDGEILPVLDGTEAPTDLPPTEMPPPSADAGSPMRPPYEARYRADGTAGLRAPAILNGTAAEAKPEIRPSMWKRMFGS
jgi:general secretion pathway protein D